MKISVAAWIAATSSIAIMMSIGVSAGAPWDLALSAWIAATISVAISQASNRIAALVSKESDADQADESADLLVALSLARRTAEQRSAAEKIRHAG